MLADPHLAQRVQARVGTTLRGKYRLDSVLGVGGMAVVYAATHRNTKRFAAKMLHPELSVSADTRSACERVAVVRLSVATFAAALSLVSASASAEVTKDQCVDANAKAQPLRRDGRFSAAREQLLICVDSRCPGIVRDDCAQRLDELDRAQPTIVFEAKDATGNDVSAVQVTIDGHPLAEKLDGTTLAIDPGDHVFVFQVAGASAVTRRFVLHEGEKSRRERIVVGPGALSAAPVSGTPPPSFARPDETSPSPPALLPPAADGSGRRTLGLVVGGAAVASIAAGGLFGVLTIVSWNKSKTECSPPANSTHCAHYTEAVADHDAAVTNGAISTIGFIAGGALLTSGIALWLSAPSEEARASQAMAIRVTPSLDTKSMGVALTGEF
jgi:hypothetical protein